MTYRAETLQDWLVREITGRGSHGLTSAQITRLTGGNKLQTLTVAERDGLLFSIPTNNRTMGRRWFAAEHRAAVLGE